NGTGSMNGGWSGGFFACSTSKSTGNMASVSVVPPGAWLSANPSTCDASPTVSKVVDGLSNTIMVAELAARNQLWENGKQMTPASTDGTTTFTTLLTQQLNYGGGGWADPNNNEWVDGGNRSGNNDIRDANGDQNSCVINCTNLQARAFY